MIESIISAISRHANSLLFIEISLLVLLCVLFVGTWIYNKKRYSHLKHQIPADVVKTYLDSIIHNSSALKSSLFRGAGADIDAANIPSVMPLQGLTGGDSIGLNSGSVSSADLNAKVAEIAKLRAELDTKNNLVSELEKKLAQTQKLLDDALARIKELEALLAKQPKGSGDDSALRSQLEQSQKELDELKEKLKEYGVIEDDLANLKRYRQENELLRKALEEAGKAIPTIEPAVEEAQATPVVAEVEEPSTEEPSTEEPSTEEPSTEEPSTEEPVAELEEPALPDEAPQEVEVAAADEAEAQDSSPDSDDKSSEDLLSEFEKMLG